MAEARLGRDEIYRRGQNAWLGAADEMIGLSRSGFGTRDEGRREG